MQDLLLLYAYFYAVGLSPFLVLSFVSLFLPLKRLKKALLMSMAALVTATPVMVPIGWGAVIAPVSWFTVSSLPGIELMLMQPPIVWWLHAASALASAVLGLLWGYYALPLVPFNRPKAVPGNSFKP